MLNDFLDPIHAEGMPNHVDSAIALDFLITVKTGIRNYAIAISETADKGLREILKKQLKSAIQLQADLYQLMMREEWLFPYDLPKQFEIDLQSAELALKIAELNLFPQDTDRQGMFATPNQ